MTEVQKGYDCTTIEGIETALAAASESTDPFDTATYYTCESPEELEHESADAAIYSYVEKCTGGKGVAEWIRENTPLEVSAYVREEVSDDWLDATAHGLAKNFSNDYGNEYGCGDTTPITGAKLDNLASTIREALGEAVVETPPWNCNEVAKRSYSAEQVEKLLRESDPEWFEESP